MGCDGGTIPKRDELVRQKQKPETKDKNAANMAKWRHCALKHDTLQLPIAMDAYGLLYNKDALLEYLLDRSKFEHGPTYIKKMKDFKELKLKENPTFKGNHSDLGTEYLDVNAAPFICPLTGLEMNGKYKFCALWTCGCVLSDRALRSVNGNNQSSATTDAKLSCPNCGQEYSSNDDIVILNPEGEDLILMEQRRERLAAAQADKKKNGSNKRKSPEAEEENQEKKVKTGQCIDRSHRYSELFSFDLDSKVDEKSATTVSKVVKPPVNTKSSIQADPTKSDIYKSLFTTSEEAKKKGQKKAHWVTYNPLYF